MHADLKRLIKFILILFILLFFIDFIGFKVINLFFKNMKNGSEYNVELAMNKIEADLFFIGASQCVGNYDSKLFEDELKLNTYNAGMGGQRLDYQVIVANAIIKRKVPKLIVWDFDPKLLADDDGVFFKLDLNTYYHSNYYVKQRLQSIDEFVNVKHFFKSYQYNSKLLQILYSNLGKEENGKGYVPYGCKIKEKIKVLKPNHYPEFGFDTPRKIKLMSEQISEWNSKGIKVYVLVSPIYRLITSKINGIEAVKKICKENGALFQDFSQLENIYSNPSYFRDEIHLCKSGAQIYSKYVADFIRKNESLIYD
jgi:hypothetical protein